MLQKLRADSQPTQDWRSAEAKRLTSELHRWRCDRGACSLEVKLSCFDLGVSRFDLGVSSLEVKGLAAEGGV